MKTFFAYDFYIQFLIISGYAIGGILVGLFDWNSGNYLLSFYYVVGGAQLISYLIRLMMKYSKDWMYIVYGILIMPIWLILVFETQIGNVGGGFFTLLFLSLFYSPVMAVFYVFYNYKTYKLFKAKEINKPESERINIAGPEKKQNF